MIGHQSMVRAMPDIRAPEKKNVLLELELLGILLHRLLLVSEP